MRPQTRALILSDNDDPVVRHVSRVLGGVCLVTRAHSVRNALATLDADPHISAVITEQVLSTGDGVDLLETIRTLRPHVRRIVLTAYSDLAAIVRGLHSGAIQALVQKPIVDSELLLAVCPELSRSSATALRASA